MKSSQILTGLFLLAAVLFTGCSSQDSDQANAASDSPSEAQSEQGLTDFEMINGIGPVTEELSIEEIDQAMVDRGAEIFDTKCSACHKMNDRYVGPPLGNVLQARTPAFVMNMMLNTQEMVDEHPIVQALLQEYLTPMPNQNLSQEDARAVVEYLAAQTK